MPTGVAGVDGLTFTYGENEATPAERIGPPADPRHALHGPIVAGRYAWQQEPGVPHGPFGVDNQLLGFSPILYTEPAGELRQNLEADLQPLTRAAPWPAGVALSEDPDDVLPRLAQNSLIRGQSFGAPRAKWLEHDGRQDDWAEYDATSAGDTLQVDIPQQVQPFAAFGNRDRRQSNARQNSYGYDARHFHRRVAMGSIPGNYDWLKPGSRPMIHTRVGTAIVPSGPDSPFAGQVAGDAWTANGAELRDLPAPYTPAATPALAAPAPAAPVPAIGLW